MYADIRALMAQQHGLIARRQAVSRGLPPGDVDRLVRTGAWVAVRRGVYAEAALWSELDPRRGRPLLVARAVTLSAHKPHVWSHDTAGHAWGLAMLDPATSLTHVTRRDVRGDRTDSGVKHHGAAFDPGQVVQVDGARVLDLARTAVDIGREHGFAHGLVACDSALAAGATRAELVSALATMACWSGTVAARAAVEIADADADGPGESLTRGLLIRAGEPEVETQFGLRRDGRTVWCDLRVRRHIIEFDGRVKYRSISNGGVSGDPEVALWEEKKRQDFVQSFRLGVSRVTWAHVQPDTWRATGERLVREIAATDRLFGGDIADLSPFILPKSARRRAA
ncbi:type IV toxin-antitoxin system AbiEi family antitoxin domain-containing protein [Nocardioides jejuensis]|uniref:AbiEi antitoxin N-terminal domain-containing protein n=1 Tax=Nocardioides jejuensis TaxID=2502782 RepID=A0A4R1CIV4_9ACTN|nr:type IV toxin-antitoxin system AbiEi family antitoxin domain-containing protein [Nocardioides jejuensis]TCJ29908.1 hypothetical protein EPD65_06315 [Nocardioides jejuensis]